MEEGRYSRITLFSTTELRAFHSYFKSKLDDTYEFQTTGRLAELTEVLELLIVVIETPRLAAELNLYSDVSLTSVLEILMTKAAMWKVEGAKLLRQTASQLMQLVYQHAKLPPNPNLKPTNLMLNIMPVNFFVRGFSDSYPQKVQLFLSFLRIHLLNLFAKRQQLGEDWLPVVDVLVSLLKRLNNFVLIDFLVTIVSWMSQRNDHLKQQCLRNGLAYYLVGFIDQNEASPEFRKKCLKFIYFLVADDEQARKTLMQTELEGKALAFAQQYPFKGVESSMQPIVEMLMGYYNQEDFNDRVGGLETLTAEQPLEINEETLVRMLVYGSSLKEQYPYRAAITQGVLKLAKAYTNQKNSGKQDRLIAICFRLLERYIVSEESTEPALDYLLREILMMSCSGIARNSSRELTYESIRTLTVLLKKDSLREKLIPLCQEINLRDKLPKEVESQDIGMVLVIDRLLWLFRDRRQIKIEEFVTDILKANSNGKIDRAEETSQKLTIVSQLIRSGGKVDLGTLNSLLNVLASQNASPVPQNSHEEELNVQVARSRIEALTAIEAIYEKASNEELYGVSALNRMITLLPEIQEKTETDMLVGVLSKTIPKSPDPSQLNFKQLSREVNRMGSRPDVDILRKLCAIYCPEEIQPISTEEAQKNKGPKQNAHTTKPLVAELREDQVLAYLQSRQHLSQVLAYLHEKETSNNDILAALVACYFESKQLSSLCGMSPEQFEHELLKTLHNHTVPVREILVRQPHFDERALKVWLALNLDTHSIIVLCAERLKLGAKPVYTYLELLEHCLTTRSDYELFEQLALPQLLNEMSLAEDKVLERMAMLVRHSTKSKSIQGKYTLLQKFLSRFIETCEPKELVAALMYGLCGLTYENPEAQQQVLEKEYIAHLIALAQSNINHPEVVSSAMELTANLAMNPKNVQLLFEFGIVDSTLKQFEAYHNREQHECEPRKQIIRAVGNCAINRCYSRDLTLKSDFLQLLKKAIQIAIRDKNFEELCRLFDVLLNILAHYEDVDGPQMVAKVKQLGAMELCINTLQSFPMNADIIVCCLGCVGLLIGSEQLSATTTAELAAILNSVLKAHMWNEKIVKKCFGIINKLKLHKKTVEAMIDECLPKTVEEVVCQPHLTNSQTLQTNFTVLTHSLVEADRRKVFASTGVVSCLCRSLHYEKELSKIKTLLKCAIDLVQNNHSTPPLNRDLCVAVIDLLHHQNKTSEKVVAYGIKLLSLLQQDILIDKNSSKSLIDFSSHFLTRSKQIMYETYELRVRDYMCLLACLINRSSLLKIEMSSQAFLSILDNWMKIAKAVEVEGLLEAVRLVVISIVNKDTTHAPGSTNSKANVHQAEMEMDTGYKCFLYRTDQSKKQACAAVRKGSLLAYKLPSGEVKQKYHLPLESINLVVGTFKSNDAVFDNSVFYKAGGFFHKRSI